VPEPDANHEHVVEGFTDVGPKSETVGGEGGLGGTVSAELKKCHLQRALRSSAFTVCPEDTEYEAGCSIWQNPRLYPEIPFSMQWITQWIRVARMWLGTSQEEKISST
jgi:hypothetical protein